MSNHNYIPSTYDDLMQEYEKVAMLYHVSKAGTQAREKLGKRMDKAAQALEAYRVQQKRNNGDTISVYESLFLFNRKQTMSHHNYTPEIEPKESPVQGFIITMSCLAVFAFIGVLLAYRG